MEIHMGVLSRNENILPDFVFKAAAALPRGVQVKIEWCWCVKFCGRSQPFILDPVECLPFGVSTMRSRQTGRHFKNILNAICWMWIRYFRFKFHWNLFIRVSRIPLRWRIESALVRIMACRQFGAKPLSKPMLGDCQLDPWEQISVRF